jgi:hypothetical protein
MLLLTMGAGQLVVTYWLAKVGPDALHDAAGAAMWLLVPQVVVTQLLPELRGAATQLPGGTPTFDVLLAPHTVAT